MQLLVSEHKTWCGDVIKENESNVRLQIYAFEGSIKALNTQQIIWI